MAIGKGKYLWVFGMVEFCNKYHYNSQETWKLLPWWWWNSRYHEYLYIYFCLSTGCLFWSFGNCWNL